MSATAEPVLLDATLRPNPPMPAAVLKITAALVAAINLAFGLYFLSRGAWPVTPFMGADVALLIWAFRASYRASQNREHLHLTPRLFRVERLPPRGAPTRIDLNPYWLRVDLEETAGRPGRLTLASHGRAVQIGSFLPPAERLSLAGTLRAALARVRAARWD